MALDPEDSRNGRIPTFVPYLRYELEFLKAHPEAMGYRFADLYVGEERQYIEQDQVCAHCEGLAACPFRGYRIEYHIDHDIKFVGKHYQMCQPKAVENRDRVFEILSARAKTPKKYRHSTLTDFDPKGNAIALTAMRTFLDGKSVTLYGGRGCGKTMLTTIFVNKMLRDGRKVQFETVPTMLEALRRGMDDGTLKQLRDELINAETLVLDDLGAEAQTPWTMEQLFIIVNSRYNDERQLLVTSNLAPSEMRRRWATVPGDVGERIYSRLSEMTTFVEVNGSDRRLSM